MSDQPTTTVDLDLEAEYAPNEIEQARGDHDEPVTTTIGVLRRLYFDAYYSGVIAAAVNFGGMPEFIASALADEVLTTARDDEEFVKNTTQSIRDRITRTNLDNTYSAGVVLSKGDAEA